LAEIYFNVFMTPTLQTLAFAVDKQHHQQLQRMRHVGADGFTEDKAVLRVGLAASRGVFSNFVN